MVKAFVQRDTAVTGKYYVDTEGSGGGGGGVNYSAEEQDTGLTWIDGSKIYQKTISIGEFPARNGTKSVNHGITGLNVLVDAMFTVQSGTSAYRTLPSVSRGEVIAQTTWSMTDTAISILCGSNADVYAPYVGYLTLKYTKTA